MSADTESRLRAALAARAEQVTDTAPPPMRIAEASPRRSRMLGWPAAAAAAALVAAVLAGTVAGVHGMRSDNSPAPLHGAASTGSSVSSPAVTSPTASTTGPTSTKPAPAPSGHGATGTGTDPSGHPIPGTHLLNLALTDPVRAQLVTAYVSAMHYSPAWITGTLPGSVYYVFDTRERAYLAWAGFVGSQDAPAQVAINMQDAGYRTAFRQLPGQSWVKISICSNLEFYAFVGDRIGHCTSTGSTSASTSTAAQPAVNCLTSDQAFNLATKPQSADYAIDADHGYGCSDGWAYVNYHQAAPPGNHATKDLHYVNGAWTIADRLIACGDGTQAPPGVPAAIYQYGCGN
jgi:hypothetical protein